MIKQHNARVLRLKRKRRVRARVEGTPSRQRLSVFRSGKHIYAQVIDDSAGRTLAAASSLDPALRGAPTSQPDEGTEKDGRKMQVARAVGRLLGDRATAAGVSKVAFDRGGFIYHGRIKALAEGARSAGLDF